MRAQELAFHADYLRSCDGEVSDTVYVGELPRADVLAIRRALTRRPVVGSRERVLAAFFDVRLSAGRDAS